MQPNQNKTEVITTARKEPQKNGSNFASNQVGKEIIDLSVNMGIGSQEGVKVIDGVPFLIVFKM